MFELAFQKILTANLTSSISSENSEQQNQAKQDYYSKQPLRSSLAIAHCGVARLSIALFWRDEILSRQTLLKAIV